MKRKPWLIKVVLLAAVLVAVLGSGQAFAESGCHRNPPPPESK